MSSPACQWGIDNESIAKMKYNSKVPSVTIYDCALIVNPQWPWLACSFDGVGLLDGKWYAIEIKCPFSKKNLTIEEACSDKNFFMKLSDGIPKLKRNHDYFFQCFGVIALWQLHVIDFIIYAQKDIFVEKIYLDKQLWEVHMILQLTDFYFKFIMPEMRTLSNISSTSWCSSSDF